jgi:hypothetical protein
MPNSITPPPELVGQWQDESPETQIADHVQYLATRAAQWGADQELEACLRYAGDNGLSITRMRATRRRQPPSLKEQAMEALQFVDEKLDLPLHNHCNAIHTIRRALEALDD